MTTTSLLGHPVLPFVLAAALVPFAGVMVRRLLVLLAPAVALGMLIALPDGATAGFTALGHDWELLRADGLARLFALAFILYAFIAGVYAWTEDGVGPRVASIGLAGAGVGVVFAGDLLSLFFFWEWLTVASLFLIWFGNSPASWAAGFRYLIFHLAGAIAMLMGILLRMADGNTTFGVIGVPGAMDASAWLILAGMVTNAAVPPLHAWLSDAYPRASIYGTVFLAAFTTKSAVYALTRGFPGLEVLVWAGTVMALFGVFYAVLENNIRRLLSYHIISQVGFMVAGVGLGSALSLNGATSHAFAHIFYKGLLMMSAGAVIYATGRGKLTDLGMLARPLRWTLVLMMIGALSISGAPLFNGFVTKSMTISAAAYLHRAPIELLLLVTSMGTFLSVALKLPWFTFFGEERGARVVRPVPRSMYAAMIMTALLCFVTGVLPGPTIYALLPFDAVYNPFTGHHYIEVLQLLIGTALGFWLLRLKLRGDPAVSRDVDLAYRRPLYWLVDGAGAVAEAAGRQVRAVNGTAIRSATRGLISYRQRRGESLALQASVVVAAAALAAGVLILLRS
jgi:multicomponent Na+:H+ antiporter subunit D